MANKINPPEPVGVTPEAPALVLSNPGVATPAPVKEAEVRPIGFSGTLFVVNGTGNYISNK